MKNYLFLLSFIIPSLWLIGNGVYADVYDVGNGMHVITGGSSGSTVTNMNPGSNQNTGTSNNPNNYYHSGNDKDHDSNWYKHDHYNYPYRYYPFIYFPYVYYYPYDVYPQGYPLPSNYSGTWVKAENGEVPARAVQIETNQQDQIGYFCRATFNNRLYYGVLIPDDACYVQDQSVSLRFTRYSVLVISR